MRLETFETLTGTQRVPTIQIKFVFEVTSKLIRSSPNVCIKWQFKPIG